ncbi:hypothetical protein BH24ACT15_BH24ACT15_32070 [soil metagenome]
MWDESAGVSSIPPTRVILIEGGRKVTDVAHDLGVSPQTIYQRAPPGLHRSRPGGPAASTEYRGELTSAKRRIAQLEAEVAIHPGGLIRV